MYRLGKLFRGGGLESCKESANMELDMSLGGKALLTCSLTSVGYDNVQ